MNATQIDSEIRARIAEIKHDPWNEEYDQMLRNYLPLAANSIAWDRVSEFATEQCANPGGGADGRPGRLYELPDAAIVEAEAWFLANPNWRDLVMCDLIESSNVGGLVREFVPGKTVTVNARYLEQQYNEATGKMEGPVEPVEVSLAAYAYVGCAFAE
jgi:hypothetical protein